MTNKEQLDIFDSIIIKNYDKILHHFKYHIYTKQPNYHDTIESAEDTFQFTYWMVRRSLLKKGIKANTEKDFLNYFYSSLTKNLINNNLVIKKKNKHGDKYVFEKVDLTNDNEGFKQAEVTSSDKYDLAFIALDAFAKRELSNKEYQVWILFYTEKFLKQKISPFDKKRKVTTKKDVMRKDLNMSMKEFNTNLKNANAYIKKNFDIRKAMNDLPEED